ncbi:hypothetical protein IT575_02515 [bacterium]|nr:hypothetical protein [bacterium]
MLILVCAALQDGLRCREAGGECSFEILNRSLVLACSEIAALFAAIFWNKAAGLDVYTSVRKVTSILSGLMQLMGGGSAAPLSKERKAL